MRYWASSNRNIGDAITPFILSKLGYSCEFSTTPDIIGAGSILGFKEVISAQPYVLGSGFLNASDKLPNIGSNKILAVRGQLTADKLKISNCTLGDFGLLISKCFPIKTAKKYKYGIISHCTDFLDFSQIQNFDGPILNAQFSKNLTLSMLTDWLTLLNSCEYILSSSLHGIVFAHAYQIPAIYLKNLNNCCRFNSHVISQNDFKFKDYYSALNTTYIQTPYSINFNNINLTNLTLASKPSAEKVADIQDKLTKKLKLVQPIKQRNYYLYF